MITRKIIRESKKIIKESLLTESGRLVRPIPLLKFRPLDSAENFERLMKIIETGKLWCSKVSELNDPMEGVFALDFSGIPIEEYHKHIPVGKRIQEHLSRYTICSLSAPQAIEKHLVWSHYAGGFRGVALLVRVEDDNISNLYPINYQFAEGQVPSKASNVAAIDSIRRKHPKWVYESEIRFLADSIGREGAHLRVTIIGAYLPLEVSINYRDYARDSKAWAEYYWRLKNIVVLLKKHDIPLFTVNIRFSNRIEIDQWTEREDRTILELVSYARS